MKDLLFDGKLLRDVKSISNKKAKLRKQEADAVQLFYNQMDAEDLEQIFDVVEKYGHPQEKEACKNLRKKYREETFCFDDIVQVQNLYKANVKNFSKVRGK